MLLRVGEVATAAVHWLGSATSGLGASQIEDGLTGPPPGQTGLRDVPDGSVLIAARAAELLADSRAGHAAELWETAAAEPPAVITIADLRVAASRAGYGTMLAGPAASGAPGQLDVVMSQAPPPTPSHRWQRSDPRCPARSATPTTSGMRSEPELP